MTESLDGLYVLYSEAQAEIEALKNSKIPDLMLEELHYVDGKIDMIASHPIFHILIAEASRMFDLQGATNFLAFTGIDKQDRHFAITIQLSGGKTPSEN